MSNTPVVFISHTTSDQRDFKLAHGLAEGLRARGVEVWIAPGSIPVGSEWAPQIVTGIMKRCTHFLVIISAASVASEWVLKEISLAQERRSEAAAFGILPLVVGSLDDYPGSDFINSFQMVPYRDELGDQMEQVSAALGLRPVVPDRFQSFIADKTAGFVGREFVFTAINVFFSEHTSGYFVIEGDPGIGKSAILAEFVKRTGCIAHFNMLAQGVNRANQFLEGVCTQIIARYGLPYTSLPPNATQDGAFFSHLIDQVSSILGHGEKLLIAVDALDEVDLKSFPIGPNILYLPSLLPRNVFLVMTRRQATLPFMTSSAQFVFNLMDHPDESREDVEIFIRQATNNPRLRTWIGDRELTVEDFVNILAEKSENNFMYLRYVLPEIERGLYEDLKIEHLPSGLEGYYDTHWRRMGMTANPLPRTKIKIVYILSEVAVPVSRKFIAEVAREDELTVQGVLGEWEQFLKEQQVDGERRYSIYHTSFRDFLYRQDIVQAAGVSVKEISSLISDSFWNELYPAE